MALVIGEINGPFGPLLVARTDRGVAAVWPPSRVPELLAVLRRRFPHEDAKWSPAPAKPDAPEWDAHPEPIDLRGLSAFDVRVYREVLEIPPGETLTYGEVAARIGSPGAARAVGGAMARCPLFPLIPCHRVVRAADGWSGWGQDPRMKHELLAREAAERRG